MKTLGKFLAGMSLALGVATASNAGVVTIGFDNVAGNAVVSTYSESGFDVTSTSGTWIGSAVYGNPGPSIFAGPVGSASASSISIVANGGGSFSLSSFDISPNNGTSGDYTVTGLLNGNQVFLFQGTDTDTGGNPFDFETILSASASLVDQLIIAVTPNGNSSINVDTIVLNTVDRQLPEPGSLALLGAALAVAGWRSRRNQRA